MNYLLLLIGMCAVSFSGPFNDLAVKHQGFSGAQTASVRLLIAGLLLCVIAKLCGQRLFGVPRPLIKPMLWGCLFLAAHFALWTSAFQFTTLSSAIIFLCAQPTASLILNFRNKHERPGRAIICGLILGWGGMILLAAKDFETSTDHLLGDVMVILASFAIVLYQMVSREANRQLPWMTFNALLWTGSGLLLLPLAWPWDGVSWELSATWPILALVLVPTFIGHGCFNRVIPYLKLIVVNISILAEPVVGIVIGVTMGLDVWPSSWRLVGMILVLLGVGIAICGDAISSSSSPQKDDR